MNAGGILYEFSKPVLGLFLKSDLDAMRMRVIYNRMEKEGKVRGFKELPVHLKSGFDGMDVIEELSCAAPGEEGIEAWSVISRTGDYFFPSALSVGMDRDDLLQGLLFRSMGLVYMNMSEDEALVFTGFNKPYAKLYSHLFDPVLDYGIRKRAILHIVRN